MFAFRSVSSMALRPPVLQPMLETYKKLTKNWFHWEPATGGFYMFSCRMPKTPSGTPMTPSSKLVISTSNDSTFAGKLRNKVQMLVLYLFLMLLELG